MYTSNIHRISAHLLRRRAGKRSFWTWAIWIETAPWDIWRESDRPAPGFCCVRDRCRLLGRWWGTRGRLRMFATWRALLRVFDAPRIASAIPCLSRCPRCTRYRSRPAQKKMKSFRKVRKHCQLKKTWAPSRRLNQYLEPEVPIQLGCHIAWLFLPKLPHFSYSNELVHLQEPHQQWPVIGLSGVSRMYVGK